VRVLVQNFPLEIFYSRVLTGSNQELLFEHKKMALKCLYVAILVILGLAWSAVPAEGAHEIIDEYVACRAHSKPLTTCFRNLVRKMPSLFKEAVPALTMPRMDPHWRDNLKMHFAVLGNLEGDASIYNTSFRGLSRWTCQGIESKGNGKYVARMKLPSLRLSGRYRMSGDVLGITVNADSTFYTILTTLDITYTFNVKMDRGVAKMADSNFDFTVQEGRARMNNLVGKNGHYLGDTVNEILSNNLKGVMEASSDSWAPHFGTVVNVGFDAILRSMPKPLAQELASH